MEPPSESGFIAATVPAALGRRPGFAATVAGVDEHWRRLRLQVLPCRAAQNPGIVAGGESVGKRATMIRRIDQAPAPADVQPGVAGLR